MIRTIQNLMQLSQPFQSFKDNGSLTIVILDIKHTMVNKMIKAL